MQGASLAPAWCAHPCRVLPREAVDGGPLGLAAAAAGARALGQGRIAQGESLHQPALGGGPDGPIRAAQAVQHHEQRPATGWGGVWMCALLGGQDTLGEFYPGRLDLQAQQMRTIRLTLLPARVTVAGLLLSWLLSQGSFKNADAWASLTNGGRCGTLGPAGISPRLRV